jgi:hypothetical protein
MNYKTIFGVILPSVFNFVFLILFTKIFNTEEYIEYTIIIALIIIPNSLFFQPFVALNKPILSKTLSPHLSFNILYFFIIIFLSIIFGYIYGFAVGLFSFGYLLFFNMNNLQKTISNLYSSKSWLFYTLLFPFLNFCILCLSFIVFKSVDLYSYFLLAGVLFILISILTTIKFYNNKIIMLTDIYKKQDFIYFLRLMFVAVAMYISSHLIKIYLDKDSTKNLAALFLNIDILLRIISVVSAYFIVEYSKVVFKKQVYPNRYIYNFVLTSSVLILVFVLFSPYIIGYVFGEEFIYNNRIILFLISLSVLFSGSLSFIDTYLNSRKKYNLLMNVYLCFFIVTFIICMCLTLLGIDKISSYYIGLIVGSFSGILMYFNKVK